MFNHPAVIESYYNFRRTQDARDDNRLHDTPTLLKDIFDFFSHYAHVAG